MREPRDRSFHPRGDCRWAYTGCCGVLLAIGAWAGLAGAISQAAPATTTAAATAPSDATVMTLLLELSNETDARVRREAAIRLLRPGTPSTNQAVVTLLTSKSNDSAKLTICETMAELAWQEPAFIPPLLALIQSRESAIALRRAAAGALAVHENLSPDAQDRLKSFRQEQDAILLAENHAALMRALHDCTPETDRAALLQAWLKQPLALERYTALDIVQQNLRKRVPDATLLGQLRLLLADPDESVRQKCVFVLRTLGQREDAPRLQWMLEQPQPTAVREAVYSALGVLGDPVSIAAVITGLDDPAPSVAGEAATALARLVAQRPAPPPSAAGQAVQALQARASRGLDDPILRERVIDAMSVIGDPAFLPTLLAHAAADEPVPAVRQAAIRGIGRAGSPTGLSIVLQQLASDPDAGVREAAAEALGRLGSGLDVLGQLRERLDRRVESSTAVQAKAWEAYLQIFEKLPFPDELQVLDSWSGADAAHSARRIDLLIAVERRATTLRVPDEQLASLRERLGDALIAASRPADAAPVLGRSLEVMTAADPGDRTRVAVKMIDSYLLTAPEKAIAAASTIQDGPARNAVAERLLQFVNTTAQRDPASAAFLLGRLTETIPDQFGPAYAQRFQQVRKLLPPATRPTSAPSAS